jgi:macrodomain Ter protein organizer (MatP/YcbG family)
MEKKVCKLCNFEKILDDYHNHPNTKDGFMSTCKECINEKKRNYYQLNKDKISEQKHDYYIENKEIIKNRLKLYRDNNKLTEKNRVEKFNNNNPDYMTNYQKEYVKYNRDNNPLYKLKHNIRVRIKHFFNSKNITKQNKTFDIVGCTPEFLKEHIEKQFTEGMSWGLLGHHIHIDHIIPLSSANTEEEIYKLCHYSNLQPLWAEDNLKKSNKY